MIIKQYLKEIYAEYVQKIKQIELLSNTKKIEKSHWKFIMNL